MNYHPFNGISIILMFTFVHCHNGQLNEGSIMASGKFDLSLHHSRLLDFNWFPEATIDCYRCRSWNFTDKSCHDPFSKTTSALIERCKINMGTSEILVPANHCIKIIGTSVMTGEEYIIRDCTVDKIDHQCVYEQMDGEKIKKCTWTCNVNGCNKAGSILRTEIYIHLIVTMAQIIACLMHDYVATIIDP